MQLIARSPDRKIAYQKYQQNNKLDRSKFVAEMAKEEKKAVLCWVHFVCGSQEVQPPAKVEKEMRQCQSFVNGILSQARHTREEMKSCAINTHPLKRRKVNL